MENSTTELLSAVKREHIVSSFNYQSKSYVFSNKDDYAAKDRKNIICYKIFEHRLDVNSKCLCTPYRKTTMTLGNEEKQKFAMPRSYKKGISEKPFKLVGKGFFHAFTNMPVALHKLSELHTYVNSSKLYVIVECEIPKDSLYFKDKYGDQICSTRIKPIKIIESITNLFYS